MLGAEIAAEMLSDGLRKERLSASHLGRYEQAWEDRLGGEIKTGLELQRLARTMSDSEIDALFLALQSGLASSVRHLVRFDWHRPALKVLLGRSKAWRLGTGAVSALGLG